MNEENFFFFFLWYMTCSHLVNVLFAICATSRLMEKHLVVSWSADLKTPTPENNSPISFRQIQISWLVCYLSFAQPWLPCSFASSFSQFPSDKTQCDTNLTHLVNAMVGPTLKRQLSAKDLQLLNDEDSTVYLFLICHLITKKILMLQLQSSCIVNVL